jgi:hypothetical protein
MIIKNVGLKGFQLLAKERRIKAKKLRKGPGMTGIIQPASPNNAEVRPSTMKAIVTMPPPLVLYKGKTCFCFLPMKFCVIVTLASQNVDNMINYLSLFPSVEVRIQQWGIK